MQFVLGEQVLQVLLAVGQLSHPVGDDRRGDQGEDAGQDQHADVRMAAQPDRRAHQHQQQPEHLRFGRGMHARQRVGEADDADRGGQCQRRTAEHQHRGHDVESVHRGYLLSRLRSDVGAPGTRATLTEPTKLISASAVRRR